MKKGQKTTAEEIIRILRQIEVMVGSGKTITLACKEVGITEQTHYRWRKEYGNMQVSEAKEFKKLKQENSQLKKLVAELSLKNQILEDVAKGKF